MPQHHVPMLTCKREFYAVDEKIGSEMEGRKRLRKENIRSCFDFKIDLKCLPKALNYVVGRLKKYFLSE